MQKNSIELALNADRDDRLAAAAITALVFVGGILSVLLLGAVAFSAIA